MSKCNDCGKVFAIYGKPNQKKCSECRAKSEVKQDGNAMR